MFKSMNVYSFSLVVSFDAFDAFDGLVLVLVLVLGLFLCRTHPTRSRGSCSCSCSEIILRFEEEKSQAITPKHPLAAL